MSLVPKHIKNLKPYVAGKSIEELQREKNISKIIKLASNENPLGPSSLAIAEAGKVLSDCHRYPDSSGYKLRVALADKFDVNINNVIIGPGSEGIMSNIMRTFLRANDEILTSENSFIGFRVLANASGYKCNWVPMKNDRYDLKKIGESINSNTKIIYLANPDNPTGTYFTKQEFDNFMENVPNRILVILDEAYYEYAAHIKDYPDSMLYRYDNVITLRTFSKIHGLAGFRVGYGFAHDELIKYLMTVKLPFEPSIPAQIVALSALEDDSHHNISLENNKIGMERMTDFFDKNNFNYIPSCANFITLKFDNDKISKFFSSDLLSKGIIVRNLKSFGLSKYVRITIGTPGEIDVLFEKINKMESILD